MPDRRPPPNQAFVLRAAADKIRSILTALEREQGMEVQRVVVDCDNIVKFTTTIHCGY